MNSEDKLRAAAIAGLLFIGVLAIAGIVLDAKHARTIETQQIQIQICAQSADVAACLDAIGVDD